MKNHRFVPDHVSSLEDRALLSGFTFPTSWGGNSTLGFKGALVLTSRTYEDVQSRINNLLQTFTKNAIQFYHDQGGFTEAFDARIGVGTYGTGGEDWAYGKGTALARLDSLISALEYRLPYGGGQGTDNPTGGAGLSDRTALTTQNPASSTVDNLSVAQLVEKAITDATDAKELRANFENVRVQVLAIHGTTSTSGDDSTSSGGGATSDSSSSTTTGSTSEDAPVGILPAYIAAFGPSGSKNFGLRNT